MEQGKSQIKAGVVLNYVNIIVGNLIPIFYTPVMLSLLGQEEYGLYKLSSSITSYLSLISLGIGSAVGRYLIKSRVEEGKDAEERVFGLFMVIFQIISVAALIIGIILSLNLDIFYGQSLSTTELSRMKILVMIMVCNTALSFSQTPYSSIVTAHEKFIFLQSINIVSTCIGPIANLVALYIGFASVGMATASLIIGLICRMAFHIYVRKRMRIQPQYHNLPTQLLREIIMFSFWIFVGNVVSQLYNATDTLLIAMRSSLATSGVAIYSVGSTLTSIIGSLAVGMSSLFTPKVNRMVFQLASGEELTDLCIRIGRIQCIIVTLIVSGFISFGRPFIYFYAGEAYSEAYWVAVFTMVPNMIPLIQSVCLSTVIAQNQHRFRSIIYLIIAIMNVIGTWLLLPHYGIAGAALMTGLGLIIGPGLIMNWYYHKITGLNMTRFWSEIKPLFLIPAVMVLLTTWLSSMIDMYNIIILFAGILLYTFIFALLSWKYILNTFEKDLLRGLIKKFLSK